MTTATATPYLVKNEFIFYLRMSQLFKFVQYTYRSKACSGLTCTDSVQFQKKIPEISHCSSRSPKYIELGHFTLLGTLSTDDDEPRGRRPEVQFPLTALLRMLDSSSSFRSERQNVSFAVQSEREYVFTYLRSVSDRKFISNY